MEGRAESLPYDRYEAVLELYQAENAVQIARSLGADQYAPDSFNKATALLSQAQDMNARKVDTHAIVSAAREAAQMAEDARTIAVKRRDEERHAREIQRSQDQGELATPGAEEDAAQAQAERKRKRRKPPKPLSKRPAGSAAQARAAQQAALAPPPPPPPRTPPDRGGGAAPRSSRRSQRQFRAQLLAQLNGTLAHARHAAGIGGDGGTIRCSNQAATIRVTRTPASVSRNVAAILASHPGLGVRVEGYGDTEGSRKSGRRRCEPR